MPSNEAFRDMVPGICGFVLVQVSRVALEVWASKFELCPPPHPSRRRVHVCLLVE